MANSKARLRATVPVVTYIYRGFEIVLDKRTGRYYTQYGSFDSLSRANKDIDSHFRGGATPKALPPELRNPIGSLPRYKVIHCRAKGACTKDKVIARIDRAKYPGWHVPMEVIMAKTRRHYKRYHPVLFKRSIAKGVKTRAKRN